MAGVVRDNDVLVDDVLVGDVDANLMKSCSELHFHVVWHVHLRGAEWAEVDARHLQDGFLWVVSGRDRGPGVDYLNGLSLQGLCLLDLFFFH